MGQTARQGFPLGPHLNTSLAAILAMATFRSLALAGSAGFGLSLLSALPSQAHGLAAAGMAAGALHPLGGLDHLLLLVGVGAAAAKIDGRLLPAALLGALLGGLIGGLGGSLPSAELLAAISVSALGLLLLLHRRLRPGQALLRPLAGAVVASAMAIHALLHGQASHGQPLWWFGASLSALAVVSLSCLLLRRASSRVVVGLGLLLGIGGMGLALLPLG